MPRLGLGTWKAPAEKTKEAILTAVKAGYRLIDCANDYDNEHVIGEALQELFAAGVVKREELFIQAKLWNSNHRPEHVKPDLMKTLEDLQLDYIDSFVIHWPQAVPSTGKARIQPTKQSIFVSLKEITTFSGNALKLLSINIFSSKKQTF